MGVVVVREVNYDGTIIIRGCGVTVSPLRYIEVLHLSIYATEQKSNTYTLLLV